ncbi:MFS transporter [Rhodococcus koreensis]
MDTHGASAQIGSAAGGWTVRLVVSTILLAMVLEALALGAAMISIALPSILREFPTDKGGWLLTAYFLPGVIAAPLLGKCADLYGKRRILLIAMTVSGIGAVICALAPTLPILFLGRVLQGFIAATLSLTYSLIRDIYPPKQGAFAASVTVTGMGMFGLVSPLLIGWLLAAFGFRGMFWFDAIWTFTLVILIWLITPESSLRRKARPDVVGGALLSVGLLGVLVYFSLGRDLGWTSAISLGLLVGGAVVLVVFAKHTQRASEPIINLELFRRRPVMFAVVFGAVGYAFSATIGQILPLLAMTPPEEGGTYGLGLTTVEYAAVETPKALASTIVGVILGFLVARGRSPRMFMVLGMTCWGLSALALVVTNDTYIAVLTGAVLAGMGGGMVNAALPNVVMQSTPASEQGSSAGAVQMCQAGLGASAPILLFAVLAPHASSAPSGGIVYGEEGFQTWLVGVVAVAALLLILAATVLRARPGELAGVVANGSDGASRAAVEDAVETNRILGETGLDRGDPPAKDSQVAR